MKCKRIFKVVSALALTVALMVSTGVVSFAAATYTTSTTYVKDGIIEVTSVASGLGTGDMATYVAYNNNEFSEANAVYIDQATAVDGEDVIFTYQTESDNVKATVKFGGSTEDSARDATPEGWTVYVYVYGQDTPITVIVPMMDEEYDGEYIPRDLVGVPFVEGEVVSAITVDGEEIDAWSVKDSVVTIWTTKIKDESVVHITTQSVSPEVKLGDVIGSEGSITAFGRVIGVVSDFGILISGTNPDSTDTTSYDAASIDYSTETVKLPALGSGAKGGFCVQFQDDAFVAGNSYNVQAYAYDKLSAVKSVTISE